MCLLALGYPPLKIYTETTAIWQQADLVALLAHGPCHARLKPTELSLGMICIAGQKSRHARIKREMQATADAIWYINMTSWAGYLVLVNIVYFFAARALKKRYKRQPRELPVASDPLDKVC